ncbi:M48 family metallopeptidase [Streptomyces sp. Ag109_G2-15]|uniref:M48 family metallopeptidase n=1 Tax=Streptomyces sp. Ag109_G2-15 TaxID=1938850 RepID=UPI000BDDDD79|nr:M56 family metallopeptidase [Streptomyces sp. Ag109_G2-15]SOE08036.1 Peptidase family M48 [Streptomyces sp. Ag109_G2-15]
MSGATQTPAPRPDPESAPPTPAGPDPGALPAGTTLRFLVLVVAMVVAMVEMLSGILRPLPYQDVQLVCDFAAGFDPGGKLIDELVRDPAQAQAVRACAEGAEEIPRWYGLAGTGTVLLAAGGLYLLLPRWKRSRRGVEPLHTRDPQGEVRAEVVRLAQRAGVRSLPDLVVDRLALDPGAVVYGRAGRRTLCLNSGLLHARRVDSARFEAVVLHELAHLRHRDVDIAYAVTALWRVFLALVVVPYTLLIGGSLVAAQFFHVFLGADEVFWPASRPATIKAIAIAAFLFLLVVLARADTLRHRELYADRGAVALGATPAVWQAQAEGRTQGRSATRAVTSLWRSHPSWAERWQSLRNPAGLFTLTDVPLFLLGVVTLVTGNALAAVWNRDAAAWIVGSLAACVLTVAVWRAVLYAVHAQAPGPRGIRAGLALGLGLVCGELLSGPTVQPGWWPEHVEPLLFPLLGSVVFVAWLAQCVRLHLRAAPSGPAVPRRAVLGATVAGSVVAAAGLDWWLHEGQLWMTGDILAAGGVSELARHSFPGPWDSFPPYESVLPWIGSVLISLAIAGASPTIAAAAVALWAYPAVLLLRRPRAEGLRSTLLAGLAGGVAGVAAVAAVMAYVHSWRPPLEERTLAYGAVYLWWRVVALWAGVVGTAAVVAATTRTHRLPRALTAAAIAQVVVLAGQFALQAADGCLGPLRVMGNTCHVLPDASWTLTELLAQPVTPAFFGAALAATAAAQLPRAERESVSSGAVRRSWPARTVVAVAGVAGIVLTAVVTNPMPGDGSTPSAVPARPEPAGTAEKVRDFQLLAWFKVGGQADIVALASRYDEFAKWFKGLNADKGSFDGDTLHPLCDDLARDTATARRHLRVPDPGLDRKWSTLLDRGGDAAGECKAVLDGSGDDVDRNTKMLQQLVAAFKQAQVTLPPLTDRVSAALKRWPEWKAA